MFWTSWKWKFLLFKIEIENSLVDLTLFRVSFGKPVLPLSAGEKPIIGGLEPKALKYENGAKLSFPFESCDDTNAIGRGDTPDIIRLYTSFNLISFVSIDLYIYLK